MHDTNDRPRRARCCSLCGACRMCVVKIEKAPKLQTACTTVIGEGMVVTTDSDEVKQARKATVEILLGNHPLDCPVCDAGGECEHQVFWYHQNIDNPIHYQANFAW